MGIFWWSLVFGFGQQDVLIPGQITAAAVLALVAPIVSAVLLHQRILFIVGGPTGIDGDVLRRIVVSLPFVALLVLAALPATRRWTRH